MFTLGFHFKVSTKHIPILGSEHASITSLKVSMNVEAFASNKIPRNYSYY